MYNNRFVLAEAQHLAQRLGQMHSDPAAQIEAAYRLCLGRAPTAGESQALEDYVRRFGLASACRVLFNSNEFLFVD